MLEEDLSAREDSVLITGATGQVGRATIEALLRRGVKPTALMRRDATIEGCATISDWLTSERAVTAIGRAAVVGHLAGNLNPPDHGYERANIVPTQRVASRLDKGLARKLIFLSYVGASEHSANRYLATKQRVAPVYLGDAVAAMDAAMKSDYTGAFDLQGPDEMSFDDLVRLVNGGTKVPIAHVPVVLARLLQFLGPKLPESLIAVMLKDSRSNHPTAHLVLGLSLRHLSDVWLRHSL